ncbi:MAG: TIGR02757 family protein [Ignavibacteriaceae bacterium]|nr:TIGR02757 family protein [Ignavibacteriaceae bacterium]
MNLKSKLEYHYKAFDRTKISPDPLQFLHLYSNEKDIELIGLIVSVFSYGNVTQIISTLKKVVSIIGDKPNEYIGNFSSDKEGRKLVGLKHRFYTDDDIVDLFQLLSFAIHKYGRVKNIFLSGYSEKHNNIKEGLSNFSEILLHLHPEIAKKPSRGIKFMFPDPRKGSACKRMNLFLRWMVRKDELDFGLWPEIPARKLIIPVDTHIARICKSLKLTRLSIVSWKMAEEITENLKAYDQDDPVKYDFALCHIGMRKLRF